MKKKHHDLTESENQDSVSCCSHTSGPKLTDKIIVDKCNEIGLDLIPVDPFSIPRFKHSLNTINYALLLSKALYIQTEYGGFMTGYAELRKGEREL